MNSYPHIETNHDYSEYERAVARFFERETIGNLSAETGSGESLDHNCVICDEAVNVEGYFSSRACECCGRCLGGTRFHATGWSAPDEAAYCYEVCTDCIYYAEYGQLDDMTMLQIDEPELPE